MLQIKLSKGSSTETGVGGGKPLLTDIVTVACPDHLVLADLPVAKSLGPPPAALLLKNVGRKNRRLLGERVHFCVRCDLPIAIYGRLSPCEHIFCLECARLDPGCYLCDQKILKIQTIKLMEGIFICAAPHCLVSFLSISEFESHIHENHANLLNSNNIEREDVNELEDINVKQQSSTGVAASDSTTARAPPPKLPFSPTTSSNSQISDRDEKFRRPPMLPQPRPPPPTPFFGQQTQIHQLDQIPNYPQNFQMPPVNPNNQILAVPPPMFGVQPFYGGVPPFEPGSVLGFPPNANFQENYPRPWNMGQPPVATPFDPSTANMAPLPHLQPPMMQPHMSPHMSQQSYPGGEMGNDGQGFGWQYDKRDNFGNNRDSQ